MCDFDGDLRDLGPLPETLLAPIDRKLAEDPDLWLRADARKPNRFSVFQDATSHIVLQYPDQLKSHLRSTYSPLWDHWSPLITPVIAHVTRPYAYAAGRTARIMLARLAAGGAIARHADTSLSAEVPHKIHVPLRTDDTVRFLIADGDYSLERGRAYEVNNRRLHEVRNSSARERIHLIFDYFDAV